MKIAIVGGGVAGLSAAIALKQRGYSPTIYEQASELREVGAGLQISPNGARVLDALGVNVEGRFFPETIELRQGQTGNRIFSLQIKELAPKRWGAPYFHVHRHDLQAALLAKLDELNLSIRFDKLIDSNALEELAEVHDLVIGADGVHSQTRAKSFSSAKAMFSGQVAYRAVVPISALQNPPPPSAVIWAGTAKHAVTTRIKSGDLVNFVGVTEEPGWQEDGWNHTVDPQRIVELFSSFASEIQELTSQIQSAKRWALLYHPPLESFYHENVVLIGDAAHPMLPSFAQGAVQALEDSYLLAASVANGTLKDFDKLRLERVARVQTASRENLETYHFGPMKRALYFNAAKLADRIYPGPLLNRLDWLYGYDPISAAQSYF